VPGSPRHAILIQAMPSEDLLESLLRPSSPSEGQRRDDALVQAGQDAAELARTRQVVAALAAQATPEAPSAALRARLLATATRPGRFGRYADRIARIFRISIADAENALAKLDDPASFVPSGIPGVEVVPVPAPAFPGALAVLARIAPGVTFPRHIHRGDETMLILAGGLREESGIEAWPGDELQKDDGTSHAFVALNGEPCIAASLVEGTIELL
jgi:putative transcriptional regulator